MGVVGVVCAAIRGFVLLHGGKGNHTSKKPLRDQPNMTIQGKWLETNNIIRSLSLF